MDTLPKCNTCLDHATLIKMVENQHGQVVYFYEHPEHGSDASILARVNDVQCYTGFYDAEDFYRESDYMPVKVGNELVMQFNLK